MAKAAATQPTARSPNDRRIDYVEFQVADIARSRKFYGDTFGWTFKDYGPGYCEFSDGRLTGGFELAGEGHDASRNSGGALVILYADDLADALARVRSAGGRIVQPVFSFPGGSRFHFADPDGYELAVWSKT